MGVPFTTKLQHALRFRWHATPRAGWFHCGHWTMPKLERRRKETARKTHRLRGRAVAVEEIGGEVAWPELGKKGNRVLCLCLWPGLSWRGTAEAAPATRCLSEAGGAAQVRWAEKGMRKGEREPGGEGPLLCLGSLEVSVGFYRKWQGVQFSRAKGPPRAEPAQLFFSLLDPNQLVTDLLKCCNC